MWDPDALDPRMPVLVGVGTASGDVEAAELMVRAARDAGVDSGAPVLLARVDRVVVPAFLYLNDTANALGAFGEKVIAPTAHL